MTNQEQTQDIKQKMNFKLFDKYDVSQIEVKDPGLKISINLEPKLLVKSEGRNVVKYGQTRVNIVERLMNRLATAGHRGKKHKIEKGNSSGKYVKNMKIVLEAFDIIEKKTGKNPVGVLVQAIKNSSPRDEVTMIEYGGARYPQAVDVSPIRRINLSLKHIAQGASDKAFNKKKTLAQGLADEIVMASEENGDSFAVRKKKDAESQADSAR